MELTAENVNTVTADCMYTDEEQAALENQKDPPKGTVLVTGILLKLGFHPGRLEKNKSNIIAMLDQLPRPFHAEGGGGWTFLNMCETRDGVHWGEHMQMDALLCLGIAIQRASFCMGRSIWNILPGGMPYVVVHPEDIPPERLAEFRSIA